MVVLVSILTHLVVLIIRCGLVGFLLVDNCEEGRKHSWRVVVVERIKESKRRSMKSFAAIAQSARPVTQANVH